MAPEEPLEVGGGFSDMVPSAFDGRSDYASYKEDVNVWEELSDLTTTKQGAVLVRHLRVEAKACAKTLNVGIICPENGVEKVLERLDKSYAVNEAN